MNDFEQIFERCNLETLCHFLICGGELIKPNSDRYGQRIGKADEELKKWLHQQFADREKIEEHLIFFDSLFSEIQSVYMQLGLRAGMKLAAEFERKNRK